MPRSSRFQKIERKSRRREAQLARVDVMAERRAARRARRHRPPVQIVIADALLLADRVAAQGFAISPGSVLDV